ncbi:MAG: nucleotidyltransferase family protein [Dysgonamonadaceae bacterium]|nr:nucleotidyltransferase family protein [Dysgonamonadaceae bacterium]
MINKKIDQICIQRSISILSALKQMDISMHKLLVVLDGNQFYRLLSIGDIQRAIIKGVSMNEPVESILRDKTTVATIHDDFSVVKETMHKRKNEFMPVIDDTNQVVDVFFWEDLFDQKRDNIRRIDLPVVIMAGGKGTRLKPLTNVIPKPLIPISDKTILEVIMDKFEEIGCNQFYMSVNYKFDIMEYYLSQLEHKYNISFIKEEKPLGTIGSVSLLKRKITTPFFVSNCDIVIDQDYRDVYEYHCNNQNDLTMITAVKSIHIPYGVIETGEDGLMTGLKEKPEETYMINTGVYILNPELIEEIPEGKLFHITHLMDQIKARNGRIGCFPVSEGSWRDMGEWPEYLKMIRVL